MSDLEEEKDSRTADQNRRRQQKFREKQRALKENKYEVPLLEQAKAELKAMEPMDLQVLLRKEKYSTALTADDLDRLRSFIKNRLRLIKQSSVGQSEREREELSNKEKAQRLCNQLIPELHSALMRPQTEAERKLLILEKIQENLFTFLEFMETKLDTSNEFLKLIIELEDRLDKQTFSKLFIRVCANYQCNSLEIKAGMAIQALQFLTCQKQDRDAALGLLRLMYINNISLAEADVDMLLQFQEAYELQIMSVFKSLQGPKMQVRESLPATMFCFTPPLLASLKDGGGDLHTQVPIQWLPHFVSIVCYSFISDQQQFTDFVATFKEGVGELYDQLKGCEFTNLLQELCEVTRQMQGKFFKSLTHQTQALQQAFGMVRKRTISAFDAEVIQVLIQNDCDVLRMMNQKPALLPAQGKDNLHKVVAELGKQNPHLLFDRKVLESSLPKHLTEIFRHQGISMLLPIQHVCMNWVISTELKGRYYLQMETGQGKTAICLAIAALNAQSGGISIIVNSSFDLLFRDFKTASSCAQGLNLKVHLADQEYQPPEEGAAIVYCPPQHLSSILMVLMRNREGGVSLIVDEFDSLLFDARSHCRALNGALASIDSLFGMTGSLLQDHHKGFIREAYSGQCIDFNVNLFNRLAPQQKDVLIFQLVKDYTAQIASTTNICCSTTPIVCILDDQHAKVAALLKKQGTPVIDLCVADSTNVESALKVFNEKQGDKYPAFLINQSQGRGLDFRSSREIEVAGGVHVIIATLPATYLQFRQFVGRTGRIGNKGQYTVILYDKESKGFTGISYLQRKLEELKNLDLLQFQRMPQVKGELKLLALQSEPTLSNPSHQACIQQESLKISQIIDSGPKGKYAMGTEATVSEEIKETDSEHDSDQDEGMMALINAGTSKQLETGTPLMVAAQSEYAPRARRRHHSPQSATNDIDRGYFEAYGKLDIHNEMLNDRVRMKRYKAAIEELCQGKVVIDVGAGTGVLSVLAANAGALKVYALENSEIVHHANKLVKDNKVKEIVSVVHGDAQNFDLKDERADVIVSEWMGYMLLYERMLPSVLRVRDKCLKPSGIMIPRSAKISLAAYSMPPQAEDLDLRSIQRASYRRAFVSECKPSWVCSSEAEVFSIDLMKDQLDDNSFKSGFEICLNRAASVSGLVLWFETQLSENILLTTSPFEDPTHWQQTFLAFKEDRDYGADALIQGVIQVSPLNRNHRALKIEVTIPSNGDDKSKTNVYQLEVQ